MDGWVDDGRVYTFMTYTVEKKALYYLYKYTFLNITKYYYIFLKRQHTVHII